MSSCDVAALPEYLPTRLGNCPSCLVPGTRLFGSKVIIWIETKKGRALHDIMSALTVVRGECAAAARGRAPPRVMRLLLLAVTHEWVFYIRITGECRPSQEVI